MKALLLLSGLAAILATGCADLRGQASSDQKNSGFRPNILTPQPNGLSVTIIRDARREDKDGKGGRRVAMLNEPWAFCSNVTHKIYVVPAHYETDFASIPAFARIFLPPFGDWAEGSVVHDWMYDVGTPNERKDADRVFLEGMTDEHANTISKHIIFWTVRLFGGGPYAKARQGTPAEQQERWRNNFVDRKGVALPTPPVPRPLHPEFIAVKDCADFDDATKAKVQEMLMRLASASP